MLRGSAIARTQFLALDGETCRVFLFSSAPVRYSSDGRFPAAQQLPRAGCARLCLLLRRRAAKGAGSARVFARRPTLLVRFLFSALLDVISSTDCLMLAQRRKRLCWRSTWFACSAADHPTSSRQAAGEFSPFFRVLTRPIQRCDARGFVRSAAQPDFQLGACTRSAPVCGVPRSWCVNATRVLVISDP